MMIKRLLPVIMLCSLSAMRAAAQDLTVEVTTEGPREGVIAVLVFTDKDGFPDKAEKAFRKIRVPVTAEGSIECVITNLPYGEYSISLLHDVNENYKADKILGFGPPKEPVGFSNITKKLRKKPPFEDTLFTFSAETNRITAVVRYAL